jgi:hypothetical protein
VREVELAGLALPQLALDLARDAGAARLVLAGQPVLEARHRLEVGARHHLLDLRLHLRRHVVRQLGRRGLGVLGELVDVAVPVVLGAHEVLVVLRPEARDVVHRPVAELHRQAFEAARRIDLDPGAADLLLAPLLREQLTTRDAQREQERAGDAAPRRLRPGEIHGGAG